MSDTSTTTGSQEEIEQIELNVELPRPFDKQAEVIHSKAKRKVVKAGRRAGKTEMAAIIAVEGLLEGHRILYAAPTTIQHEKFWKACTFALADPIQSGLYRKNESEHVIELPFTDQRIKAKTAWNADTLRGDWADVLILDEWQLMNEDAWERVGAPMLLDNNGDALFIFTPPSLHSRSASKAKNPRHASKMFKEAQRDTTSRWAVFHWTSHDNPHLSRKALENITLDMTVLAVKQEIMAEDVDDVEGALWKLETIDRHRVRQAPLLRRVVVGVDPTGGAAEAGIVAVGIGWDGHGYVLRDDSVRGSPGTWAGRVVKSHGDSEADKIVAERNYGGEMVEHTIRSVEGGKYLPVAVQTSTRGKLVRAEPAAALYERGLVHHVGDFTQLEEEMCSYVPGDKSPNRMDALVFALIELFGLGSSLEPGDSKQADILESEAITVAELY